MSNNIQKNRGRKWKIGIGQLFSKKNREKSEKQVLGRYY